MFRDRFKQPRRAGAVRMGAGLTAAGLLAAGLGLAAMGGVAQAVQAPQTQNLFNGLNLPFGLAVDAAGDVYVINNDRNQVLEFPAGATSLSQGVALPFSGGAWEQIAVDSAGDVFVLDNAGQVLELPAGADSPVALPVPVQYPLSLAADSAGDVFVSDVSYGADGVPTGSVVELPAGATSSAQAVTLPLPDSWVPTSLGVDAAGDIFAVAESVNTGNAELLEFPAGSTTAQVVPAGSVTPESPIAVDAAGDVFVGNFQDQAYQVLEVPAGATSASQEQQLFANTNVSSDFYLGGLAVDPAGDIYAEQASGQGGGSVYEVSQYQNTQTSVTSVSPGTPTPGQPFTVNVSVAPTFGSQLPEGQVTVSDGQGGSCTATLAGGDGSCQLTEASAGSYTLTASYAGDGGLVGSVSGGTPVTVGLPQAISFTSAAPSQAVYGGSYTPAATGGGSGNPVTFTVDPSSTAGACTIGTDAAVSFTGTGTCVIDANQAGDAAYLAAPPVQQSFTISPAVLTVTANNASRLFGGQTPALTATITGFVNGDTSSVVSGAPACTTTALPSSPAGTYPITCTAGTLSAADYTFAFTPGTLTVGYSQPCLTGLHAGSLTVAAGQSVCLGSGYYQVGAVTVKPGGSLDIEGAKIGGLLTATGASQVRVCGGDFLGVIDVTGTTGLVAFGDDEGAACAGNDITFAVALQDNAGGVEFDGNTVYGAVTITGNTGSVPPPDTGSVVDVGNHLYGPANIQ